MYDFYDSEIVKNFELSDETIINERKIVESNIREISDFQKKKLIDEGKKNWDRFYNHYESRFFKDRNWVEVEFEHIFEKEEKEKGNEIGKENEQTENGQIGIEKIEKKSDNEKECSNKKDNCSNVQGMNKNENKNPHTGKKTILEMGCGVGNTLIPLLMKYDAFDFIGIDFSKNAIRLLNKKWNQICKWNDKLKKKEMEKSCKSGEFKESEEFHTESNILLNKTNGLFVDVVKQVQEKSNGNSSNDINECKNVEAGQVDSEVDREVDNEVDNEVDSGTEKVSTKSTYSTKSNEIREKKEQIEECFKLNKYRKLGNLIKTCVMDITEMDTSANICEFDKVDIVLLIFVLSSIHPEKMKNTITHAYNYLKKGGHVIIRDYGLYDLTQVRFAKKREKKISPNFYVRGDNTFVYFFKTEELHDLFCKDNYFEEVENRYITRIVKNRKRNLEMKRIWVQGIFRKV